MHTLEGGKSYTQCHPYSGAGGKQAEILQPQTSMSPLSLPHLFLRGLAHQLDTCVLFTPC